VGTLGGLAKFNGKEFITYSTEEGLFNNRVSFLGFIGDVLWIGHEGGVSRLEKNTITKWSFEELDLTANATDIIEFKGRLLIASNGGGLYELKSGKMIRIPMNEKTPISMGGADPIDVELHKEDDLRIRDLLVLNNELWIGTRGGVLKTLDLKAFEHIRQLDPYSVSDLCEFGDQLYVSTYNDGLLRYSRNKDQFRVVEGIDPDFTLRGCILDSKGNLWVNSSGGVFRVRDDKVTLRLDQSNGLLTESIRSVFEDQQGNIWFGSDGKGLLRFPGERFVFYNESSGLSSDLILNVNQDAVGNYWIGTFDQGLMMMDRNKKIKVFALENNGTVWTSLLNVDGLNWFGTGMGLIAIKDQRVKKTYYAENGLPGDKVTALLKINQNSFYVGGSDGVSLYEKGVFKPLDIEEYTTVRDFCRIGNEVFCATDNGLFIIRGKRLELVQGFKKTAYSLARDDHNSLWIGTQEGLFRLRDGKIMKVTFSKLASSNYIMFLEFAEGRLFVGTNNGLFVFSKLSRDQPEIINFGIAEGVVNLETNLNSGFVDKRGRLWFGTASGLVSYLPGQGVDDFSAPQLLLRNILVNFQQTAFEKYAKGLDRNGLPVELKLPYTKNNVSFELDGISLANYAGIKFQYWLEGQDESWSPLTNNNTISYNGLAAGDYILHARCVDSRGRMSRELEFAFTVKQAFYKTWWFIGGMLLLLGFLVLRIFRFRLKREREKNEKEKLEFRSRLLALEQKSLNASMNRHFIFNSLNSIQYFINTQDRLSANRFLTNFAKLIRKNLDSSDDGNLVSLSQELERLELYMSLESMRFKDRFDYKINCPENIDQESIIIPAMMLQPFIENSIIHGILPNEDKKGLVTVDLDLKGDILTIQIEDNGVGIEASMKSKADYDGDHRSQGMEITTKRIELLKKLTNRSFELIGPVQIMENDRSIKGTRVTLKFQVENLE
jgi:ligand-binding sensor domain-containing protein/anti-sigma regulatory factor (Ser/Thr protein kinase)